MLCCAVLCYAMLWDWQSAWQKVRRVTIVRKREWIMKGRNGIERKWRRHPLLGNEWYWTTHRQRGSNTCKIRMFVPRFFPRSKSIIFIWFIRLKFINCFKKTQMYHLTQTLIRPAEHEWMNQSSIINHQSINQSINHRNEWIESINHRSSINQ